MWIAFSVAALVALLIFATIRTNCRLHETTERIYQQLAGPVNGKVSQMPPILGRMTALEVPVQGGKAFYHILDKQISFYVQSPELKNCMHLWINDNMRKTLGSYKSGDPDFDRVFSIYKGPGDTDIFLEMFDQNCRRAMLQLKAKATEDVVNIWIELIHVRPRDDIFSIKINNFLLPKMGMTWHPYDISVYKDLLDKSMEVWLSFRQSACTGPL